MADAWVDVTDPFDGDQRKLKLVDNGDGTYSIASNVQGSALPAGGATSAKQDDVIGELEALNSLVPDSYDYISLAYTGDNLTTVLFKTGGSGGSTISTLTLAYTGSQLDSVTKT